MTVISQNILMFGDWHWNSEHSDLQEQRLCRWLDTVEKPVVIELGAGTHIPSVRHFAEDVTHRYSGTLIRINPREADVNRAEDIGIACGALEGLTAISVCLNNY